MTVHRESGPENRLGRETSPYLLLHRHNPVDWYPWGEEALQLARREGKPIFLSVGYSTCYWCHVMERESFSDPATASLMNRLFVNIKVDREERPELDEIYMTATQLLSRHGGWPNSVFLTPGLKPFYAGTYFPPEPRHGQSSFSDLLEGLGRAWAERREDVERQAEEVASTMARVLEERGTPAEAVPAASAADRSLAALASRFDSKWGGFGAAPKFPTPANLFLLAELADGAPEAARMLTSTLDQMGRGGIYDQLAGGFHRYATDGEWKVPHFEKMLYDNGLLLEVYAREYGRVGDSELARVARETAAFIDRELGDPAGGFWSAIDAEVDGHEGGHHAWREEELREILGEEDFSYLAPLLGFAGTPFFEGTYVLHLPLPMSRQAARRKVDVEELWERILPLRRALHEARLSRDLPLVDDKVLTDWNGMAIAGFAVAGRVLRDQDLLRRAARAASFLLESSRGEAGILLHSWRQGKARIEAFLGDYVFFVHGLLALFEATGEEKWASAAAELTRQQVARLGDPAGGFFVSGEKEDVLFRSKEVFDGALPSGNAMAALNLLRLAEIEPEADWLNLADACLRAFASAIETQPDGARMLSLATRRYHALVDSGPGLSGPRREASMAPLGGDSLEIVKARIDWDRDPQEERFTPFRLRVTVAPGWHLYANPSGSEHAPPTVLSSDLDLRELSYGEGEVLAEGEGVRIYRGRFELRGEILYRSGARLRLEFSPCDESRCLPAAALEIAL